MNDAFAALAVLAKHPRIDPDKIAVMGFSKGAIPSVYASMNRFQNAYAPEGASFAAYIGFYTPCNTAMIDDEKVSAKPIRLYHGIADDWVPVGPCRDYVARLKKAGANIDLVEYPGAIMLSTSRRSRARCSSRRRQLGVNAASRKSRRARSSTAIRASPPVPVTPVSNVASRSPIMLRRPTPRARTSSNFSANFSTSSRSTENERAVNIHRRVEIEKGSAQCRAFFCVLSQLFSSIDGTAAKSRRAARLSVDGSFSDMRRRTDDAR